MRPILSRPGCAPAELRFRSPLASFGTSGGAVTLDTRAKAILQTEPTGFAFGRFVLRRRRRLLLADGEPVELGSRAFEVLLALIEADGALLTKDALLDRVWPGIAVEENNLQVQVSALRRVLGQDRDWIATVPGRGYSFIGPVAAFTDERATLPPLSIIVMPFAACGDDPARDWLADCLTDNLIADLARALAGSTVIPQTAVRRYKGHGANVREIGGEQGMCYVIESSVLLGGNRVRVNAQLIETGTGAHLWADRFDEPRQDVLHMLDEIVGRLSRAIRLHMNDAEARRVERGGNDHGSAPESIRA